MVIIRLARGGAKKHPFYNMVVADSRNPRDGKFIERIGFYNPRAKAGEEAKEFFVSDTVFPQTIDLLKTRALPQPQRWVRRQCSSCSAASNTASSASPCASGD